MNILMIEVLWIKRCAYCNDICLPSIAFGAILGEILKNQTEVDHAGRVRGSRPKRHLVLETPLKQSLTCRFSPDTFQNL